MFGLHFRVENRIWSISGKFEIFEILVRSSNRFDDVSVVADNPEELAQWLENYISEGAEQVNESDSDRVQRTVDTVDDEQLFETANVEEAEGSKHPVVEKDLAQAVGSKQVAEELMSIDDLLLQIPDDMLLPSVTSAEITKIRLGESISINEVQERDLYYASLPRISALDKGKEILEEDEPVKGNPVRETVELICGGVEFLVQLRDRWAETDSLETAVKRKMYILAKYRELLLKKFLDSHRKYFIPGYPWTATTSQIIDLLIVAHSKSLEALVAHQKEHGLPVDQPCTSTFLDASVGSGAVLAQFYSMAKSTCWVRPLVLIDGVWTPIQGNDFLRSSCKLSLFVNRKKLPETVIEDTFVPHVFFIEPVQYWGAAPALIKTWGWHRVFTDIVRYHICTEFRDTLHDQDANAQKFINSVCQDARTISDVQKLHLNEVKKVVLAQGVTAGADSLEIRKEFKELDAKINSLDGHVAAIKNEQLEFQTKIAADILSLSTQLGDIIDYIRGGDAKKGERSSSRRPLPTLVHQSEGTGDAVRITEPTQADIDNANREILERMRNEDRERERRERSRGSRSGSYKR
ncbi:hypothetical protein F511_41452 [Dorcoceras hygrometricum]|uniref:Uncharacterized protein n=1 Tax=Dorcoceras hygrometricum TaxID=472368 RepID=A0A2Z7DEB1_9LAMI|nr:hypothetical protein F511_41452 [Dorcoceras hygrometricum]